MKIIFGFIIGTIIYFIAEKLGNSYALAGLAYYIIITDNRS